MFGWVGSIIGILLLLFAGFMIFFFPGPGVHQTHGMDVNGVILGFVAGIAGVALLLLP